VRPSYTRCSAPQSAKSHQMKKIVTEQFRANKDVVDPARIHLLKQQ
jgi:hypothetical protein